MMKQEGHKMRDIAQRPSMSEADSIKAVVTINRRLR
jgi:hypothetical protein